MPQLDAFGILLVVIGVLVGTFLAYGLYLQGVKDAKKVPTNTPITTSKTPKASS